jgi:hypothetical protein
MALLVIPFVSFAARFTTRGTIAGVALTAGILLAATQGSTRRGCGMTRRSSSGHSPRSSGSPRSA